MLLLSAVTVTKSILTLCLGMICITGDKLVDYNKDSPVLKAISDNLTHGIIGLVSYLIVVLEHRTNISITEQLLLITTSFLLACTIDVDHFVMARSWKLVVNLRFYLSFQIQSYKTPILFQHATNLPSRPFLHCSTIPVVVLALTLLVVSTTKPGTSSLRFSLWSMMVFCAFVSHHIRDATRRGLWFLGYGHTVALPYWSYVAVILGLPWIILRMIESLTVIKHTMTYNRVVDV